MEVLSKFIEQKNFFSQEVISSFTDLLKPDTNTQIIESFQNLLKQYKKGVNEINLIYVVVYLLDINKEFKSELTKKLKSNNKLSYFK